jgi:hypothetical protein
MNRLAIVLFAALELTAQTSIPVAGKTEAVVRTTETATFYHTTPGDSTCALAPGSVGSLVGCTYTPPSGVVARQTVGGCQVMPNDSVFNADIYDLPTHANSATMMLGTPALPLLLTAKGTMNYNIIDATTPTYDFLFNYTPDHNGFYPFPTFPFKAQSGSIINGPGMGPNQDIDDVHVYMIRRPSGAANDCEGIEIYKRYARTDFPTGAQAGKDAQSGVSYSLESYAAKNKTTNAVGMPGIALKLRLSDFLYGPPRHALGLQVNNPYINAVGWVWPGTDKSLRTSGATAPPYGSRLRLKASFSCTATGMNPAGTRAEQLAYGLCETTSKRHGFHITDGSTNNWDFWTEHEMLQDADVVTALATLRAAITPRNDLEIVDLHTVEPGSNPEIKTSESHNTYDHGVDPEKYNAVTGAYPADYAKVIVTRTSDSVQTPVRLVLRAVTVGVKEVSFTMLGGQTVPVSAWVGGSSNQAVTFTATGGTISGPSTTSNGTTANFTAPNPASKTTYVITATAAADSGAISRIFAHVLPAPADGVIRLDIGSATATTDSNGDVWHSDAYTYEGTEAGLSPMTVGSAADWNAVNGDNMGVLHRTLRYVVVGDFSYFFYVPNGNYLVEFWIGKTESPITHHKWLEAWADVNGRFCSFDVNLNGDLTRFDGTFPHVHGNTGIAQYTARKITCPATVTDGRLIVSMRQHNTHGSGTDSDGAEYDSLRYSALRISPSVASPQITLATEEPYNAWYKGALRRTETVRIHPVCWWVSSDPGCTNVSWSLSGPGTLTPVTRHRPDIGLTINSVAYTAPDTPTSGTATITATSTTNPELTGSIELNLEPGSIGVLPKSATVQRGGKQTFTAWLGATDAGPSEYDKVGWSRESPIADAINIWNGEYFAPLRLSSDGSSTVTATSTIAGPTAGTASVEIPAAAAPIRLNAGSGAATFSDGANTWTADPSSVYLFGTYGSGACNSVTITGAPTGQELLYRCDRASSSSAVTTPWGYSFPFPQGLYTVTLKFAENRASSPAWNCNIDVNGVRKLSNFNHITAAGGIRTAYDATFNDIVVPNGATPLTITFTGVSSPGCSVSGVEVVYTGPVPQSEITGSFVGTVQ